MAKKKITGILEWNRYILSGDFKEFVKNFTEYIMTISCFLFPEWFRQVFFRGMPTKRLRKNFNPEFRCQGGSDNIYTPVPVQDIKLIWPIRYSLKKLRKKPIILHGPDRSKKLAIIIPFRHREYHLEQLAPALHKILNEQNINFEIIVIEQVDDGKPFNRGMVCNVGFDLTKAEFDYFCFHDVDMIPVVSEYGFVDQPAILSNYRVKDGLDDHRPEASDFGGVVLFSKNNYLRINGFSNQYWGWGYEDNDLLLRCLYAALFPCRLEKSLYHLLPHPHSTTQTADGTYHQDEKVLKCLADKIRQKYLRVRKMRKGLLDYRKEGLNTLNYQVISREQFPLYKKIKIKWLLGIDS